MGISFSIIPSQTRPKSRTVNLGRCEPTHCPKKHSLKTESVKVLSTAALESGETDNVL